MKVNEIFLSINGEVNSEFPGSPTVFVRLTGCNLRCSYCDTKYAYEKGEYISIEGIVKIVQAFGCPLVTITGGEPLGQSGELKNLVPSLLKSGTIRKIVIETNGSLTPPAMLLGWPMISWVMDYKLPTSQQEYPFQSQFQFQNPFLQLTWNDWIKFVIGNRGDFERAVTVMRRMREHHIKGKFALSPTFGGQDPNELASWILQEELWDVVLSLQLHKMIGMK